MTINKKTSLHQLDTILSEFDDWYENSDCYDDHVARSLLTRMRSAISRLAPPCSAYTDVLSGTFENHLDEMQYLAGGTRALRDDYAAGFLQSYRELLNADLFSDFLEMAAHLLNEERLKQPAAVMAAGVLEEHLRKLCEKFGIATIVNDKPVKSETMNVELRKSACYGSNEQKQVTAWLAIRNSAAHAKYDEFEESQIHSMIDGVRWFVSRYPA